MSELFGPASNYSSSGIDSLAQAQDNYNTYGTNTADSDAEQAIQNVLSNVGDRSNVRNSVNYDPIYAQAFNMSRGLQPGNRVEGVYPTSDNFYNPNYIDSANASNLARPSYLQPQVQGEKGMYFSNAERLLQETDFSKFGLTGILKSLIEAGQNTYEKGKDIYDDTFKDTIFKRFDDNENKVLPTPDTDNFNMLKQRDQSERRLPNTIQSGIMENMDRAESTDLQRALMAGYDNARMNPVQIDPNTRTAMSLKDVQNFLTSPDVVGKGLDYAQPYIQKLLPEGVNFDGGIIYDPEKPDDTYTGIKFTIPFSTG